MTHILPTDDGFTEGTPVYNTWHEGYTCFLPRSSAASIGPYLSSGWSVGYLHDGYSVFSSGSGPLNVTYGEQTIGSMTGSASVLRAVCMLHREESSAADCEVSISTNVHRPSGGAMASDMLLMVGVVARAQGGSVVSAGSTAHRIVDGDCYAFGLWNNSTSDALYQLLRVNAGAITVLETGDDLGNYPGTAFDVLTDFYPQFPFVLRMEITDEAGDVRIRCYREHSGALVSVGALEDWNSIKVIDYLDTSGSKITTAGRFGFFATGENTVSSTKSIQLVQWFKVEVGGVVRILDEFRRAARALCAPITGVSGYASGRSLQSLWSGDAWSLTSPTVPMRVSTPGGLTDRCMIDPGVVVAGTAGNDATAGFYQYQRQALDQYNSRRAAEFRISSNDEAGVAGVSTSARVVGLWMRGALAVGSQLGLINGYSVHVKGGGAGTCYVKVRRWVASVGTVIAQETAATAFTIDADHTVDFEVYNLPDGQGSVANGTVVLVVKVDGVQVVLTVPGGVTNVTALASGTIYDASPSRILAGTGEGVLVYAPDGSNVVYVDDWDTDTLSGDAGIPANDEATIAVASEIADVSGTLTLPYDWPVEEEIIDPIDGAQFEDGYRRSGARFARSRRAWRVSLRAGTATQLADLITFWDAHKGVSFNFTPRVESVATKAVFADDVLEHVKTAPSIHGYSFGLVEVF